MSLNIFRLSDYNRYKAELSDAEERNLAIDNALDAYKTGLNTSSSLSPINVIRLSIGLNFCLFLYEIVVLPLDAVRLGTEIFDAAVDNIDSVDVSAFSDVKILLQTLRDDLALWSSSPADDNQTALPKNQDDLPQEESR